MSFFRFATLLAAVASVLTFVANLTANLSAGRFGYLAHASPAIWFSLLVYPFHLLVLTIFFTALFVRQKG